MKEKDMHKINQDSDSKRQTNMNFKNNELNLDLIESDHPLGYTLNKKASKKPKVKPTDNLDLLTQSQTMFEN
jgi:hypothetical protein